MTRQFATMLKTWQLRYLWISFKGMYKKVLSSLPITDKRSLLQRLPSFPSNQYPVSQGRGIVSGNKNQFWFCKTIHRYLCALLLVQSMNNRFKVIFSLSPAPRVVDVSPKGTQPKKLISANACCLESLWRSAILPLFGYPSSVVGQPLGRPNSAVTRKRKKALRRILRRPLRSLLLREPG